MSDKSTIEKLLQGMLGDINKITGKQDSDLTECINTLLNGSGQGGGGNNADHVLIVRKPMPSFSSLASFSNVEVIQ